MVDSEGQFCTLYIVRHGETDWNTQGLLQGHQDTQLNKNGHAQALALQDKFRDIPLDAVFSSDLQRASETARIIASSHQLTLNTVRGLREKDYGPFEGKPLAEVPNSHEDVETDEQLINRVTDELSFISRLHFGQNVLIVTHGGVVRNLLIHLNVFSADISPYAITNGALVVVKSDGMNFSLEEVQGVNF